MISRPRAMEWLERWRDKDVIKVVTGLRRCGKSSVLALFQDRLRSSGVEERQILSINFESLDEEYPLEARALYAYIKERLAPGTTYVFLDEVQHVKDFQVAVDALAVRDDVDLYITGSNAYLLSGELATLLTGRYVELRMLPLSFAEYASAFPEADGTRLLGRYLDYGGLPFITRLDDEQSVADYVGGVFNTVIVNDVAVRRPGIDMAKFRATAQFVADNVGNLTSLNRIANGLSQNGTKTSAETVGAYLEAMVENYLAFKAPRYDIKGRALLATLDKYYLGDLGFRYWLLGGGRRDLGHKLENAVYLELLRRWQRVNVGKQGSAEVDFVGWGGEGRAYYQVSLTTLDPKTLERELAPLRAIGDGYPKTLITLDTVGLGDEDGIKIVNAVDWLLGE